MVILVIIRICGAEESRLVDVALDGDLVRRVLADVDGHVVRRDVGDLAVQAVGGMTRGAVGFTVLTS